jgi:hypothetical protein
LETVYLNARELIVLAAMAGAEEFAGIPDGFRGMDEAEIGRELVIIRDGLAARGYARFDFDGNFDVSADILRLIGICASYDKHVLAEKANPQGEALSLHFFLRNGEIVSLKGSGGDYALATATLASIHAEILRHIAWEAAKTPAESKIILQNNLLQRVKDIGESEFDDSFGKKALLDAGCGETEAEIIRDGLRGAADYISAIITDKRGSISNVTAIRSPKGALTVTPVPYRDAEDGSDEAETEFRFVDAERFAQRVSEALCAAGIPRENGGYS